MSRLRPLPFRAVISEIPASDAPGIPGLDAVVAHWTEGACTAGEWFEEMDETWGASGLVMRRGEETLGFAVYGPPDRLPRVWRYPVGQVSEDAALLAYVGGDRRVRKHLLVRALRDLRFRGYGGVEAVGDDLALQSRVVVPTGLLLEGGWRPVRRGLSGATGLLPYTLLRVNLGSTVEVGELARGIVDRVRLPVLGTPSPTLNPADASPAPTRGTQVVRARSALAREPLSTSTCSR